MAMLVVVLGLAIAAMLVPAYLDDDKLWLAGIVVYYVLIGAASRLERRLYLVWFAAVSVPAMAAVISMATAGARRTPAAADLPVAAARQALGAAGIVWGALVSAAVGWWLQDGCAAG